jgi:ADP-heptose:LPS heptosyltransferase
MNLGQVNRIIVICRLRTIGDALLATPAVRTLKMAFPRAHLTYVTQEHVKDVLLNNPDIDELLIYDSGTLRRVADQLEYDLAINLGGGRKSANICLVSGAKYRVGPKHIRVGHPNPYNLYTDDYGAGDIIAHFLSFTKALGLKGASRKTNLFLTSEENNFAESFWQHSGIKGAKPVIGLHPGGDRPKKLWAAKNYAILADKLIADSGYNILIFQGPGEEKIANSVCLEMQEQAMLVPLLKLREYAALINKCHLLITSDGAPLHMAAALGTNLIGIFCKDTQPDYWFPYGDKPGCRHLRESSPGNIPVAEVIALARKLIAHLE